MKLLHCADLHLDSKMTSILDKERARERKAELLHTFQDMVSYAVQNDIFHILESILKNLFVWIPEWKILDRRESLTKTSLKIEELGVPSGLRI